ncbi:MAG: DUF4169 family protein [Bosea sp. (in: a-proteobacteria)]
MAEIVNLRQARKAKLRQQAEDTASQNRAMFGRTKAEKSLTALQRKQEQVRHEGHRLDAVGPDQPSPKKPDPAQ